jgi:hypothetical protein
VALRADVALFRVVGTIGPRICTIQWWRFQARF